jgi:cytochrome d ubiquinol oxidase subunit II
VWLLVAGGATFAAFPEWYAALFSGFYLPLLLILLALIVRGVAIEYRSKVDDERWRRRCDLAIVVGSVIPAFGWGVAFGNIVRGVPLSAQHIVTGSVLDLVNPYALLAGLVTLGLFTLHGAVFLALKTDGAIRTQARTIAARTSVVVIVAGAVFLLWTQWGYGRAVTAPLALICALALVGAALANHRGREGWAFLAMAVTLAAATATLFLALYPDVLPSTTAVANSLTVDNASSTHYTLTVMSWVAVVFTPIVLAYQAYTYWVFRQRISVAPAATDPAEPAGPTEPVEPDDRVPVG